MNETKIRDSRPLGIIDLMICTAAVALCLAWTEAMQAMQEGTDPSETLATVQRIAFAVIQGLSISALVSISLSFRATNRLISAPGHWLVIGCGILSVGHVVSYSMLTLLVPNAWGSDTGYRVYVYTITAVHVLGICCWLIASIVSKRSFGTLWFVYFILAITNNSLMVLLWSTIYSDITSLTASSLRWFEIFNLVVTISYGLTFLCVIAALIVDRVMRRQYDWLHWIGVLLFVLINVVMPVVNLVSSYLLSEQLS